MGRARAIAAPQEAAVQALLDAQDSGVTLAGSMRRVASLWAGYGVVSGAAVVAVAGVHPPRRRSPAASPRAYPPWPHARAPPHSVSIACAEVAARDSRGAPLPLVVKEVAPPRGEGASHDRKLRSYQVGVGQLLHTRVCVV